MANASGREKRLRRLRHEIHFRKPFSRNGVIRVHSWFPPLAPLSVDGPASIGCPLTGAASTSSALRRGESLPRSRAPAPAPSRSSKRLRIMPARNCSKRRRDRSDPPLTPRRNFRLSSSKSRLRSCSERLINRSSRQHAHRRSHLPAVRRPIKLNSHRRPDRQTLQTGLRAIRYPSRQFQIRAPSLNS